MKAGLKNPVSSSSPSPFGGRSVVSAVYAEAQAFGRETVDALV